MKFKKGDTLLCQNSSNYNFHHGGVYTAVKDQVAGHFASDPYISVNDDEGVEVECHARRFCPVKLTHKNDVKIGDAIWFEGDFKTVATNNVKRDNFIGRTIFGDSFKLGTELVKVRDFSISK